MIFDGHSDIFSDVTIKNLKNETNILETHHLERLQKGGIEGGIFTIWSDPPYDRTPRSRNLQTLEAIQKEMRYTDQFIIVTNYAEIAHAKAAGKFYIVLGIEGLSGIGNNPELIDYYYSFGVRHAMLTWNEQNELATGAYGDPVRGLTDVGRQAVRRIQELHMLMDVSHLNETSFWDVIDIADKPIVASHSNASALFDAKRNLTDNQLKAIRDYDGIIGINSYSRFVSGKLEEQTLTRLADHLVYISETIGAEHIGFGFDFYEFLPAEEFHPDGTPKSPSVKGLEDCSLVPDFIRELETRGFNQKEIEGFKYRNWHRIIKQVIG